MSTMHVHDSDDLVRDAQRRQQRLERLREENAARKATVARNTKTIGDLKRTIDNDPIAKTSRWLARQFSKR